MVINFLLNTYNQLLNQKYEVKYNFGQEDFWISCGKFRFERTALAKACQEAIKSRQDRGYLFNIVETDSGKIIHQLESFR